MKHLGPTIFLLLMLLGCASSPPEKNSQALSEEETDLIQIALPQLIGPDSFWRTQLEVPLNFLPPPDSGNAIDFQEFLNRDQPRRDSLQAQLDALDLIVRMEDSLKLFSQAEPRAAENLSSREFWELNSTLDPSFFEVTQDLIAATQTGTIDLNKIETTYRLEAENFTMTKSDEGRIIGDIGFSRPVFDANRMRACLYGRFSCGGECGGASLFFFLKQGETWTLAGQEQLWVN